MCMVPRRYCMSCIHDIVRLTCGFFVSLILAGFPGDGLAQVTATGQPSLPSHYYYHGRAVDLILDSTRLGVRSASQFTTVDRSAASVRAGLDVTSETSTGVTGWTLLNLGSSLFGAAEADLRIRSLLSSPAVDIASPVFLTPD